MDIRPIDANALMEKRRMMTEDKVAYNVMCDAIPAYLVDDAPTLSINTLRDEIYNDAVAHGLWDYPQYCRTKCEMLDYVRAACVERVREELTEAMEAVSDPDEFAKELTDAAITIFSTFGHLGIDADKAFRNVMEANKGRAWKHGKE